MGPAERWRARRVAVAGAVATVALVVVIVLVASGRGARRRHANTTAPRTSSAPKATTTPTQPAAGLPARPPPARERFGASVNSLFLSGDYTPQRIDAQLAALRRTGATIARCDTLWEATEPEAPIDGVHHYDWSFDDSVAGSLAAQRLRWLALIDYSAPWAESVPGQDHSAPSSASDFAAYAAAFAARYGPGGSFWREHPELRAEPVETYEIWNEEDSGFFWKPAPDPARYAALYAAARDAVEFVDPTARVLVGGLTNADFLASMLSARPDLRGHIDGVAIHPYGHDPADVLASIRASRTLLQSLGLATTPLYVTEFGWTTHVPSDVHYVPPNLRPAYIFDTITPLAHSDCDIAATLLYTWTSPERDPADPDDWFGIHPPSGGSNPDVGAFAAALRTAAAPAGRVALCS